MLYSVIRVVVSRSQFIANPTRWVCVNCSTRKLCSHNTPKEGEDSLDIIISEASIGEQKLTPIIPPSHPTLLTHKPDIRKDDVCSWLPTVIAVWSVTMTYSSDDSDNMKNLHLNDEKNMAVKDYEKYDVLCKVLPVGTSLKSLQCRTWLGSRQNVGWFHGEKLTGRMDTCLHVTFS